MNRQELLKKLRPKNTKKKHWLKYPNYKDYLDSQEWIEVKKIFKKGRSPRCQFCGTRNNIHVHHVSYNRLGLPSEIKDLTFFCKDHHEKIHDIEKDKGVSVRVATKMLMATKPKKKNRILSDRENQLKKRVNRIRSRKKSNYRQQRNSEINRIKEFLRLQGVTVMTKNINILRTLENKYKP